VYKITEAPYWTRVWRSGNKLWGNYLYKDDYKWCERFLRM